MIDRIIYWRSLAKDKIFLTLLGLNVVFFVAATIIRNPRLEHSPVPYELATIFIISNIIFSVISIRREPFLAYSFLMTGLLLSAILYLFFRYLTISQGVG